RSTQPTSSAASDVYKRQDDRHQRQYYTQLIKEILQNNEEVSVVLSFSDPYTLLMECGEERPIGEKRLYILDNHQSTEMNGIRLAQEIRRFDY
ncbi:hypothetical protein KQJ29_33180, partial [Enterococcus sp. S181_ASV_20]|nr:hypothetical protein [Enterococcus sp. S181_ASV_20]